MYIEMATFPGFGSIEGPHKDFKMLHTTHARVDGAEAHTLHTKVLTR